MSDPVAVLGYLEDLSNRLDKASRELFTMHKEFEAIANTYDDTFADMLVALIAEYEDEGKRLPGEDVRNAIITKKMREQEAKLFTDYRSGRAKIDRYERRAKRIEKEIEAQRSILSYLKTEAQATGA